MEPETAAGPVSGDRGGESGDDAATVLVVDDNRAIADTYAAFLREEYTVRTAYGGQEALAAVDAAVDVVLLDRRMPDVSGDEVLAEIRARALDPRVVMLTAVDPDFDIVDMPFDAYVVKPVERRDVVGVVAEMCQRASYDDEFRRFLSLASKRAALEREKDEAELADSEEYDRIEERLDTLRERLGIDTEDVEGIFGGTVPDIASSDAVTAVTSE
jgi:DNA-binding response OmpR family regulator